MDPNILSIILAAASESQVRDVSLKLDRIDDENIDFQQETFFRGYFIQRCERVLDDDNFGWVGNEILELYFSQEGNKILLYTQTNYYHNDISLAKIYEIKDIRKFIQKYRDLAERIGLPDRLPPDQIPFDESISGEI